MKELVSQGELDNTVHRTSNAEMGGEGLKRRGYAHRYVEEHERIGLRETLRSRKNLTCLPLPDVSKVLRTVGREGAFN